MSRRGWSPAWPCGRRARSSVLLLLVDPLSVALDVLLPRSRHSESPFRDVVGDDRASRSVRRVADANGRNEGVVNPGPGVLADARPVLHAAVVVGRDRAAADVGL